MCECVIGIVYDYEDTRLVTLNQLKARINFYRENGVGFTLSDYCDKRKSTDMTQFNYCPFCGKEIDWKAIKKEGAE